MEELPLQVFENKVMVHGCEVLLDEQKLQVLENSAHWKYLASQIKEMNDLEYLSFILVTCYCWDS